MAMRWCPLPFGPDHTTAYSESQMQVYSWRWEIEARPKRPNHFGFPPSQPNLSFPSIPISLSLLQPLSPDCLPGPDFDHTSASLVLSPAPLSLSHDRPPSPDAVRQRLDPDRMSASFALSPVSIR